MKRNTLGTSIIEALVVMVIVITGVVGIYDILTRSQRFSRETGNRIIATQIAREGIEAMINMRDTNAILFSGDMQNCWNTWNYTNACIGANDATNDIAHQGYYTIYKDIDNRWKLSFPINIAIPPLGYANTTYKNTFKVTLDTNGLYTQSGGTDFKPLFTRKIYTEYIDTNGGGADSSDEKLKITSTAEWAESSSPIVHNVTLQTTLSNWKGK